MSTTTIVSAANFVLYLAFYTAYSKTNKQLELKQLLDVLLVRRGIDFTLVEYNKALSLAGLTNLALALLIVPLRASLIWQSMLMLWTHSLYSAIKFYGSPHIPRVGEWLSNPVADFFSDEPKTKVSAMKKLSLVLGSASQILLAFTSLPAATLAAATGHFFTMEVDYKMKLQVRPYALLPFPLAAAAIAYYLIVG
mmetsp:Transcript_7386/g.10268  ORF Transcript_7386/g.10268 Transcript_7386/m.10268 type:complete len:195 (+) Transcript_7386:61-645(+)